ANRMVEVIARSRGYPRWVNPRSSSFRASCDESTAMGNGRRLLYSPGYAAGFREALRQAREDLDAMDFRHQCALADLRRELDETRSALNQLKAAVLARQHAEAELASLYREREIAQARAVERDPIIPLH